MLSDGIPYGPYNLQGEADSVREGTAVVVCSPVCETGDELVREVVVGPVDLNHIKSCLHGPACGLGVLPDDLVDLRDGQCMGNRTVPADRHRRGRKGRPACDGRLNPSATVVKLNGGLCSFSMDRAGKPGERWDPTIGMDP